MLRFVAVVAIGVLVAGVASAGGPLLAVRKHVEHDEIMGIGRPMHVTITVYNLDAAATVSTVTVDDTSAWPASTYTVSNGTTRGTIASVAPSSSAAFSFTVTSNAETTLGPVPAVVSYSVGGDAIRVQSTPAPRRPVVIHSESGYHDLTYAHHLEYGIFAIVAILMCGMPASYIVYDRLVMTHGIPTKVLQAQQVRPKAL
ncbi:Translocon-associated protein subunit beta [Plasmodiophora brassicae]